MLAGASGFPSEISQTLADASRGESASWHLMSVLVILGCMTIGYLAARTTDRWGRQHFVYLFNPTPADRAEKIGYLLLRTVMMSLHVGIFAALTSFLVLAIDYGGEIGRYTGFAMVGIVASIWLVYIVFLNVLAPDAPSHRMVDVSDEQARKMSRAFVIAAGVSAPMLGVCWWMEALGLGRDAHVLALIAASLVAALALSIAVVQHRGVVAELMRGEGSGKAVQLLSRVWHVFAVLYFIGAWAVSSVRLLMDLPSAAGLVGGPVWVFFAGVALYGLGLLIIDRVAERRSIPNELGSGSADDMADEQPDVVLSEGDYVPTSGRTLKGLAEQGI